MESRKIAAANHGKAGSVPVAVQLDRLGNEWADGTQGVAPRMAGPAQEVALRRFGVPQQIVTGRMSSNVKDLGRWIAVMKMQASSNLAAILTLPATPSNFDPLSLVAVFGATDAAGHGIACRCGTWNELRDNKIDGRDCTSNALRDARDNHLRGTV